MNTIEVYKTDGFMTIGYIGDSPAEWTGHEPKEGTIYWSNPGDEVEFAGMIYGLSDTCEWEEL